MTLNHLVPLSCHIGCLCAPKSNPLFSLWFLTLSNAALSQFTTGSPPIGDLIFTLMTWTAKPASEFLHQLHCLSFTQHINFPTHNSGHKQRSSCLLNWTCSTSSPHSNTDFNISDHLTMDTDINTSIPKDESRFKRWNLNSTLSPTPTLSLPSY